MSRTWVYLTSEESKLFKQKAESLELSENELTQKLIRLYLNTQNNTERNPETCINCYYYQLATSSIMQSLMRLNEFFTLIPPPYMRTKTK